MTDDVKVEPATTEESVLAGEGKADEGGEDKSVLPGDDKTDTKTDGDKAGDDGNKTDDEKAAEAAAASEAKDDSQTDGTASYELPEGAELAEDAKEAVEALFADAKLNSEQAQKFIDFMFAQASNDQKAQEDSYKTTVQQWAQECKDDKDFGGDAYAENQGIAKKAIDVFGTPELPATLKDTGMDNNPELFRLLVKVGKTLKEDDPGAAGNKGDTPKDRVNKLYPHDNNDKS